MREYPLRNHLAPATSLVITLAAIGIVGASTPTPTPDIKPDWTSMQYQLGTWNCSKTGIPNRPGTSTSTVVNTMTLDDHWMLTHSVSPPFDAVRTKKSELVGYIGYERASQLWIFFGATNFGFWDFQTSPGWRGDTITWTVYNTSTGEPTIVGREILTKISDTETQNRLQHLRADGALEYEVTEDCKKV
jgi:hypothetical protein